MDVFSYKLGKAKGGGGTEPTGTITITENGTHNVKNYASAEVNVPVITPTGTINITSNGTYDVTNKASAEVNVPTGGGTPTSFNDVEKELKDLIKNTPNNYETYTTNNITLYTPDINYQKYCIYKNDNKYRIAWLYTGSGMYISNRSSFSYVGMGFDITSHNIENLFLNIYQDNSGNCYRSDEYNSIDECIQAIQSNSTTYYTRNINTGIPMGADTPYIIPYTNTIVVDYYNGEKQLVSSKKLSSNETIQVKS